MDDAHAAAQLAALSETTPDVLVTIDAKSRVQFVNPAIEDVLGYPPEDLLGEPLTAIMPDDLARRHDEALDRYLSTGEQTLEWQGIELPAEHRAGHQIPLHISFSEFSQDGQQYFTGIMRDVSDRHRWAEKLERLTQFSQDLLGAESVDDVSAGVIAAAEDVLECSLAELALFDPDAARLWTAGRTSAAAACDGDSLFRSDHGLPWQVFVEEDERLVGDRSTMSSPDTMETPLESAVLVPIGKHGVLIAGESTPDGVSETDRRLARILGSTIAAVLDRLDREQRLRERTAEQARKNEEYERVQRLNDVIREITQALLSATSRKEIKQVVCDRLADNAPYRFVWFGEHDPTTDVISPVAWAGVEKGYLDAVSVTADDGPTGRGPAGRAVRSGTADVQNDLRSDPPFEPWRQEAIKREYRAAIAVPVAYRESSFGVLVLYADEVGVFTDLETSVLAELGEMVGYGLATFERSGGHTTEKTVELEFLLRDEEDALLSTLQEHEGVVEYEHLGHRDGTAQRAFVTVDGVPRDAIRAAVGDTVEDVTILSHDEQGFVLEGAFTGGSLLVALLDRGAMPTTLVGRADEVSLTLRMSASTSIQELVELLTERYGVVELLARRESSGSVASDETIAPRFTDRLTERQEQVLATAYYAGFFEQPREQSAREVAEMLDVSQPTVSRHIRTGERALFSSLFGDR